MSDRSSDNYVCVQANLKCSCLCTAKCDNMVKDQYNIVLPVMAEEEEFDEDIETSDIEEVF